MKVIDSSAVPQRSEKMDQLLSFGRAHSDVIKIKGEYYTYQDIQDMYGIGMITRAKFDAYCTRLRKLEEDNHSQKIRIQMYRDLYHILYDLREKFREEVREENEHN